MNAFPKVPELRFERLLLSNGQRLHVVESGPDAGPTLVFLHGGAGHWRNFSRQVALLAPRYRILAPDLRGHGVSPWNGPCHFEDFCQDVRLLLDLKVPGPFVLIGHSFGGGVAARVARGLQDDSRLLGLCLISTSGCIPQGFIYRFLQLFCSHSREVSRRFPYAVACDSPVAQHLLWHILPEWDNWADFPHLRQPTLAVASQLDLLIRPKMVRKMAEALPNCRYRYIPQCGHVPMWEATAELQLHLDQWLTWVGL